MFTRTIVGVTGCLLAVLTCASPVAALTQKECSEKYQAAKSAGTLGGKSWNDFRKTECAANAAPAATEPATKPATTETKKTTPPQPTKEATPAKPAAAPSNAVFPTAVSSKYSSQSAGKARMHTCLDQYHANKANNAKWRLEVDHEGRGLLQRVQQATEGLNNWRYRLGDSAFSPFIRRSGS